MLVISQRRDFLQRRVIDQQRLVEAGLRQQADGLLLSILPASVADRLKRGEVVADLYDEASVLFADMVNFTPFSSHLGLPELVHMLNDIFSEFDIPRSTSVEGSRPQRWLPGCGRCAGPRPDHAVVLVQLGLEMCAY
jgi:hypothetical protein